MIMTNAEIVREYREAKTPLKQIGILADENQCSKKEIVDILTEAGLEVPPQFRPRPFGAGAAEARETGDAFSPTAARSPLPEGARDEEPEAEYGPILPPPKLAGLAERVNDGAIEVIARLLAVSDASPIEEGASLDFREQVRGVLALVHELRGAEA